MSELDFRAAEAQFQAAQAQLAAARSNSTGASEQAGRTAVTRALRGAGERAHGQRGRGGEPRGRRC